MRREHILHVSRRAGPWGLLVGSGSGARQRPLRLGCLPVRSRRRAPADDREPRHPGRGPRAAPRGGADHVGPVRRAPLLDGSRAARLDCRPRERGEPRRSHPADAGRLGAGTDGRIARQGTGARGAGTRRWRPARRRDPGGIHGGRGGAREPRRARRRSTPLHGLARVRPQPGVGLRVRPSVVVPCPRDAPPR